MAVDNRLLACQLKINGLDEFKPYKDYLVALRDKHLTALATIKDADMLRQYQGRAQQLIEIIGDLEQASVLS